MSAYPFFLFIPALVACLIFAPLSLIGYVYNIQFQPNLVGQIYLTTFTGISLLWIYTPLADMGMGINGEHPEQPHRGIAKDDLITVASLFFIIASIIIFFTYTDLLAKMSA